MANDIYSTTHNGLSKLVSPRVASRVLETALRKRKLSSDKVTAKEMKSLLRGPVLNDLTGILPKGGLEHSLHQLSKTVAKLKAAPTLVEALDSPEPWDDTPPLSTAPARMEPADIENDKNALAAGIIEESPPPSPSNLPKVELSKSGETTALVFDTEPAASPKPNDTAHRQDSDAPDQVKANRIDISSTPAGEMALAEPETLKTSTERILETLEANVSSKAANVAEIASDNDTLQQEFSDQQALFDPAKSSTEMNQKEGVDLAEADPYATLIDAPAANLGEGQPTKSLDDSAPELETKLPVESRVARAEDSEFKPNSETAHTGVTSSHKTSLDILSDEVLDETILQFAQLEHVRMVAALLENGKVASSRGDGFDLETLSRLGTLGLKLLSRSGELRSYYLAFKEGQLFFFPLQGYTLCIIGTTELNLGLVFATLQKLKEDV